MAALTIVRAGHYLLLLSFLSFLPRDARSANEVLHCYRKSSIVCLSVRDVDVPWTYVWGSSKLITRIINLWSSLRGGSSPKILGGGHCPHLPFHHRVHFLCSPKPKKYELHIQCVLKIDTLLVSEFSTLVRCIIFAIFVYLHIIYIKCLISEPVQVYCRQYRWTHQQDDAPSHTVKKHDKLSQKGECFIHQASDVASKQP